MFLPLLASMLMTCEQYDWLAKGVFEATTLSPSEKVEFIYTFAKGTDPKCFKVEEPKDAKAD
jgi:hypothetical protein